MKSTVLTNKNNMKTMIENLINGNLTEARKQARNKSWIAIKEYLKTEYGWSAGKATFAADYLKTGLGWQEYCDAK